MEKIKERDHWRAAWDQLWGTAGWLRSNIQKSVLNLGVSLILLVEHFLVGCNAGANTHTLQFLPTVAMAKARGFAVSYQQITE